jgi:hypothetical protein
MRSGKNVRIETIEMSKTREKNLGGNVLVKYHDRLVRDLRLFRRIADLFD